MFDLTLMPSLTLKEWHSLSLREQDSIVARQIFGIEVGKYEKPALKTDFEYRCTYGGQSDVFELPHYTTDMNDAWKVMDWITRNKWCCIELKADYHYVWDMFLTEAEHMKPGWPDNEGEHKKVHVASSEHAAVAICTAALVGKGYLVKE